MNNLYFKGLYTEAQELNKIKNNFENNGLSCSLVFDNYSNLPLLSKNELNAAIDKQVRRCNPIGQNINIICHSMGCNLGVLHAEKSTKIKKIVLISPEFGEYSKKEKYNLSIIQTPFGEKNPKLNGDAAKSLIIFKRTKPYATLAIERINVPVLIIYSKDDELIPKEYLKNLSKRKDNIKLFSLNSKLHNPLASKDHGPKTMKLIKNFLN